MLLYEIFSYKLFFNFKNMYYSLYKCCFPFFSPLSLSLFVSELDMSVARLSQEASSSEDSILIISLL